MAHKMTDEERIAFLRAGTRTAKLAVTRPDGRPHVTPVWFDVDGDDIVTHISDQGLKAKLIQRDPHVCVVVDDQEPPFSFVLIDGIAEISEDLVELRKWSTRFGARYMGEDRAEEFGARNGVKGELLIRIRPTRIVAMAEVAGY